MEFQGSIVENEEESSLEGIKSMRRGFWLVMRLSIELKVLLLLLLSIGYLMKLYPSSWDGKISENKTLQREFLTSKFPKCVLILKKKTVFYSSSFSVKEHCTFTPLLLYIPLYNFMKKPRIFIICLT
uniref:Uncharacterized protein n=1 Tax=Noccaea caerulescens TaxID=107243 RepID=A0A1J3CNV1_NOCCA